MGNECAFAVFRQGLRCTKDELTASAFLTVNLDDSMGGVATQVTIQKYKANIHKTQVFLQRIIQRFRKYVHMAKVEDSAISLLCSMKLLPGAEEIAGLVLIRTL